MYSRTLYNLKEEKQALQERIFIHLYSLKGKNTALDTLLWNVIAMLNCILLKSEKDMVTVSE